MKKIAKKLRLSRGLEEFLDSHSQNEGKETLSKNKIKSYETAVKHLIAATGEDKDIHKYYQMFDFSRLLLYMEDKNYTEETRVTLTKRLAVLWNYFIKQGYTNDQLVKLHQKRSPEQLGPIPYEELRRLLSYYNYNEDGEDLDKWEFLFYLLLTMSKPSTALLQKRSDINLKDKYILIRDEKSTKKHPHKIKYPVYEELEELLTKIMQRPVVDGSDRLFSHFEIRETNYNYSLWWWYSDLVKLKLMRIVPQIYELQQIRKSFPEYAIKELGLLYEEIRAALDLVADESMYQNYYELEKIDKLRAERDKKRMMENLEIKDIEWDVKEINLHPIELDLNIKDPFGDLDIEDEDNESTDDL